MKKNKIIFIFLLTFFSPLFALPFNSKLKPEEQSSLTEGKVIIRNIDKYKNMCIDSDNLGAVKLRSIINELDPNYLAEVIQVRPYKGNENLKKDLRSALENVSDYAGIPYYSVRHDHWWDLYSTAEIISKGKTPEGYDYINADLYMKPFGMIHTPITIDETDDYLLYTSSNSNTLKAEGITCVRKFHMKSVILLIRDGDSWILYGAGGVKAPKVAFLQERIETSFINRIKTFCNFIFTKI